MILYIVTMVVVVVFGVYSILLDKRQLSCPDCKECNCPKCPPPKPPCPDCTRGVYPPMADIRFGQQGGMGTVKFPYSQPSDGTFYFKVVFNTYAQTGLLLCSYNVPQLGDGSADNKYLALYLADGKLNLFLSYGANVIHKRLSDVPVANNKVQTVSLEANKTKSMIELYINGTLAATEAYSGSFDFRGYQLTIGGTSLSNLPEAVKKHYLGCIKRVVDHKEVSRTFVDFFFTGGAAAGCSS